MTIRHFCEVCGVEADDSCSAHPRASLESIEVIESPGRVPPLRLDTLIDAELDRLGWSSTTAPEGSSTLDAWNSPTTDADGIVTLHDSQEVTRFHGLALLETLRTLPDEIDWDALWHEILPHMVAE